MASAPLSHSASMSIEELKELLDVMEASYPFQDTRSGHTSSFDAFAYTAMQAILPMSFSLLANIDDVVKLQFKDVGYAPGGLPPRFQPFFSITLAGREQVIFFLNGSFGLSNLHQITEEEVLHELNVQLFLCHRWLPYAFSLNAKMAPQDFVFPSMSGGTDTLDWSRPMPCDYLQQMLDKLATLCRIPKKFGMSSPRIGGAKYRLLNAPSEEKWRPNVVMLWTGWTRDEVECCISTP
ncbi:hypothetical protein H0H93_009897 [Arthromyces matolae]|nr:hypothetical protein H0H93_009897 [Arthromyces matolae]